MRIGIYGGTFNPIHSGHLHILREFHSRLKLDEIILIPTCMPPHKAACNLAAAPDRLNMCTLAAGELNFKVQISDLEIKRADKSYTVDTIETIKKTHPNDEFFLLMGEDMFLTVDKWYKAEQIFALATICASPRSKDGLARMRGYAEKIKQKNKQFAYLLEDIPFMDVSSTVIRGGVLNLLPVSVSNYIEQNNLYRGGKDE